MTSPKSHRTTGGRASHARGGFTLIELLTVIAIIGILAAIMIPTIQRIRQTAYAAKSTSNLRQLGVAANLYANDNKGYYPPEVALNAQGQADYGKPWTNDANFTRYVSVVKPDWKPADQSIVQSGFPTAIPQGASNGGRATIGMNVTDIYTYSSVTPAYLQTKRAMRQADVKNPGRLMLFAEAVDYKITYDRRAAWQPAYDTGAYAGDFGTLRDAIAYRVGVKSLMVTYSGSIRYLSRTEANDKTIWQNFITQ